MLEKGQNKAQKSKLFDTIGAAKLAQKEYGGKISILKRLHEEVVEEVCDLDCGLDDVNPTQKS